MEGGSGGGGPRIQAGQSCSVTSILCTCQMGGEVVGEASRGEEGKD